MNSFAALGELRHQFRGKARDHEICRLQFEFKDSSNADKAKKLILDWAQDKSAKQFPPEAFDFQSFEVLSGGRNTLASTIIRDGVNIWALRNEDPDNGVAGRVWSTEVVVASQDDLNPKMSVRLLAHSSEEFLPIKIGVPAFINEIYDQVGIAGDAIPLNNELKWIGSDDEFDAFVDFLKNAARKLPIIAISNEGRTGQPLIRAENLPRATLGLAHVIMLNKHFAWRLSEAIGSELSVFDGGIRIYMPSFAENDDWRKHRLLVGRNLQEGHEKGKADGWFRRLVAEYSLERLRLGSDVLSYTRVRSESRKLRAQTALKSDSSTADVQIEALKQQNDALEKDRDETIELSKLYELDKLEAVERAEDAEQKLINASARIAQLEAALESKGLKKEASISDPENWEEIVPWCEKNFVGKLNLTPSAKRGLKKPEYESMKTVIDALRWLAKEGREARISGAGARLNNEKILGGLTHARCGGDEYQCLYRGERRDVDWHIKNGDGNTRDPKRCLRIYYFWDEQHQEIVVADLPAHRKNENS